MINVPASQQLRFARTTINSKPIIIKKKKVDITLIKDQNRRINMKPPWIPTASSAFRSIILIRFFAAMYNTIQDCDEVFNYWEPLHFITQSIGFQTWEYSPTFAIRSYAYLLLHLPPIKLATRFMPWDKRPAFFILRLSFAFVSSFIETILYRSIVTNINARIGRYFFLSLLFSAGIYTSTTNFLPSTFAMWGVMLSTAFALQPVDGNYSRIIGATFGITVASIVGWPFAALLGVPLVLEQLFFRGSQVVEKGMTALWAAKRARNLFIAGIIGLSIAIPVVLIDSHAYQKFEIVPLNIIRYNIFPAPGIGPNLYGVSPPSFYFLNGLLAFNILFPLSLLALPVLFISTLVDSKRFGDKRILIQGQTTPAVSMAIRLSGLYLWLGVLTLQPHKEERFLFPAYGLILLNSSTTIWLMRGWVEAAYLKITKSPYRLTLSPLFSTLTRVLFFIAALTSLARIFALRNYYRAPLNVYHNFQTFELPRLAVKSFPEMYSPTLDPYGPQINFTIAVERSGRAVELEPLAQLHDGKGLQLCIGKEWHRFPSHFLVPKEVSVGFLKSDFKGILPKKWNSERNGKGLFGLATDGVPTGMNDRNLEEVDRYVQLETCDYIIDLDFPHRSTPPSPLEPRFAIDSENWQRVYCHQFLDNENSPRLTRIFWLPFNFWTSKNSYGDYCLLRNKALHPK